MDSRIPDVLARLHERDRLLTINVIADPIHRCVQYYELVRMGPSGPVEYVGRWEPHEVDRIVSDIATMDRNAHGHKEAVDILTAKEDERERDSSRQFAEYHRAALEHGAALINELEEGKTFFGQAGLDLEE